MTRMMKGAPRGIALRGLLFPLGLLGSLLLEGFEPEVVEGTKQARIQIGCASGERGESATAACGAEGGFSPNSCTLS